jgi:uncharacterized cupin superfamily protein
VDILENEVDVDDIIDCASPKTVIDWDITTHVSELNPSVGGKYIDTLSNVGCGSIRGASASLSLLPYDLGINPDTWIPTTDNANTGKYTTGNDAVFARLLQSLYADLHAVQVAYACTGTGSSPLSSTLCASLTQRWNNGLGKLTDCINAAFQPKQSASNQLCNAFVSQLGNYQAALPVTTPAWDTDNRVGELKARIETLFHLHSARFLPSIPEWGFCMEFNGCTAPGTAPPPWAPRDGDMPQHVLNIDAVQLDDWPPVFQPKGEAAQRFGSRMGQVGAKIGARLLGYNVTVVSPGKRAFPLHNHHVNEEMFFILSGSGELRIGDEHFTLRAGDFIANPPGGAESAHQIINTGTEELRYLAVSTMLTPEIVEYPDSGKFAASLREKLPDGSMRVLRHVDREGTGLDYWDGE